jgi:serine/threonine protein kinase
VAPEQAVSSAGALPQSDLYAVGVIMYQMFTGQLPFLGEKALDIAKQHLTQSPPSPRAARPELSPALEAVILKTLAKKPEDRYPSGATLADALDEALSPTVVVGPRPNPAAASAPTLPIEPVLAAPSSPTQVLSGPEPQPAEPPPAAEPVETTSVSPESVTGGWINQISQNIPVLWIYAGVVLFLIAIIIYLALIAF